MTPLTARPIPIQKPVARERLKVFVHLVEGFGARRWSEASTKGQIAGIIDRLPYGYYRASDETCAVEYSEDREESVLTRFLRLAIRRLIGFDILHAWRNRRGIFDADVVWTHTELEHLAVLLLWQVVPRGCRPKLIAQSVWLFDRWEGFSPLKRWLYRKLLAQANLLTVLSPENLKIAQRIFPGNRTEFIRFGIDHGRLTPAMARKSRAKARILALGRDMHRDWATLIEAAGDWEQCELRIGAKKISHRLTKGVRNVTLVQPTTASEVRDLYRWADLVVLSLKPNFHASGITVLAEAALSGVPVVCTDTGGLRAYFSGEEVRYVPPENAAEMRAAIKELAADHHLRHQFARKAQARLLKDNITSHSYALRHRDLSMELAKARYECREMVDRGQSMFASSQPMRVFVFLGHGFGASWARGELPGINERLPYGYYHASDSGCTVKYSRDAGEGRLTRILRLGMRRVLGFDMLHAWRNRNDLFDTDVVWTHTELEHLAVLALWQFIPRRRRPKIIAQCVWLLDKWGRLGAPKRWLYKKLLAQADVVTAQSPESLKAVRRLLPDVRSQLTLYGIDADAMVPAVQRHVHKPLRILSLGRDMHRDWTTLIDAVGGWEECEVRIGAKSIARRLARRSQNIRLVTPDSRELRELYAWADMIVIPLKPNLHVSGITVVAEAALFGVPMVCTDTGGLRAYFSDDEVRYVPANDPGAMRGAIEQLAANDTLRFEMTRKAQERLLMTELSTRARARRLVDLSRDLLRAPRIGTVAEGQSEDADINI